MNDIPDATCAKWDDVMREALLCPNLWINNYKSCISMSLGEYDGLELIKNYAIQCAVYDIFTGKLEAKTFEETIIFIQQIRMLPESSYSVDIPASRRHDTAGNFIRVYIHDLESLAYLCNDYIIVKDIKCHRVVRIGDNFTIGCGRVITYNIETMKLILTSQQ